MKIAILTNFNDFHPGYSLSGIVQDQARMLAENGHEPKIFACQGADLTTHPVAWPVRAVIPRGDLIDYESRADLTPEHHQLAADIAQALIRELRDFDFAFTHDWLFTGWNLPYAEAVAMTDLPGLRWRHWIHSIPAQRRDWWNIRAYGPHHMIVYPNESDRLRVAMAYRGDLETVRVIPHIKDPRTWFDLSDGVCLLIDRYPAILEAQVVQLLPAGQDRLHHKRLDDVIEIFGEIKRSGKSVCLVVANQWATGRAVPEKLEHYDELAVKAGLRPEVDFIFTSRVDPAWKTGIGKRMVRELFQLSNLFVFPTFCETFGLVAAEAALAGCFMVLNRSLLQQMEISDHQALSFDFGAYDNNLDEPPGGRRQYLRTLARLIVDRMTQNEAIRTRTLFRLSYNWNRIYRDYYAPLLAEKALETAA